MIDIIVTSVSQGSKAVKTSFLSSSVGIDSIPKVITWLEESLIAFGGSLVIETQPNSLVTYSSSDNRILLHLNRFPLSRYTNTGSPLYKYSDKSTSTLL